MPGVSGMDLLEQIVAIDPRTEVILMTGYYAAESAVEAIHKGAADYLTKPLDIAALQNRVSKLIERTVVASIPLNSINRLSKPFNSRASSAAVRWSWMSSPLSAASHPIFGLYC